MDDAEVLPETGAGHRLAPGAGSRRFELDCPALSRGANEIAILSPTTGGQRRAHAQSEGKQAGIRCVPVAAELYSDYGGGSGRAL